MKYFVIHQRLNTYVSWWCKKQLNRSFVSGGYLLGGVNWPNGNWLGSLKKDPQGWAAQIFAKINMTHESTLFYCVRSISIHLIYFWQLIQTSADFHFYPHRIFRLCSDFSVCSHLCATPRIEPSTSNLAFQLCTLEIPFFFFLEYSMFLFNSPLSYLPRSTMGNSCRRWDIPFEFHPEKEIEQETVILKRLRWFWTRRNPLLKIVTLSSESSSHQHNLSIQNKI